MIFFSLFCCRLTRANSMALGGGGASSHGRRSSGHHSGNSISNSQVCQARLGQVRIGKLFQTARYVRLGQVMAFQARPSFWKQYFKQPGMLGQVRLGQVRLGQVRLGQVRLGQGSYFKQPGMLGQVRLWHFRLGYHSGNNISNSQVCQWDFVRLYQLILVKFRIYISNSQV